jgi:hypothetical protein
MAGVRRDLLAQKLANFLPDGLAEFPEWAKLHSFKVNKINLYKVDETFPTPRLEALGADVAARISNFSCTLSLVGLATEEMTLNQFTSRIEEILR